MAKTEKKKGGGSKTVSLKRTFDMSKVKDRSLYNTKQMEEGDYLATIVAVEGTISSNGNEMWVYALQLDEQVSAVYPYRCILNTDSLWKLRNLHVAAGNDVPKSKAASLDAEAIVGNKIGVTLVDDEYEGKPKSVVDSVFPASDLEQSESTAKKPKKGKASEKESDAKASPKNGKGKKSKGKKVSDDDLEEIEVAEP